MPATTAAAPEVVVQGDAQINLGPSMVSTTSVAANAMGPHEATVRFNKWVAHGNTAYQKGQHAGFHINEARELERRNLAVIVQHPSRMVTK